MKKTKPRGEVMQAAAKVRSRYRKTLDRLHDQPEGYWVIEYFNEKAGAWLVDNGAGYTRQELEEERRVLFAANPTARVVYLTKHSTCKGGEK